VGGKDGGEGVERPAEGVNDGVERAGVPDLRAGVEGLQVELPARISRRASVCVDSKGLGMGCGTAAAMAAGWELEGTVRRICGRELCS
jgi:hypothetical protein